ncbi:MAG: ComF family protein [Bacteroidetes bacterium]|nr:ComF family protein [Bacteroidota bacterium]MBS1631540.1 ComF family protein [Bacteroidota bacterium]
MTGLRVLKDSFLHFLFPHICSGCGSDLLSSESSLCLRCMDALPETNFEIHPGNPVEKKFWGRLPIEKATAQYYFTKESLIQTLVHRVKYKRDKDLGLQLGRLMGSSIKKSDRFSVDALIPLPLFPAKEKRRGYNQSLLLCEGISEIMQIPVLNDVISRPQLTETQTRKGRIERWVNMEGKFILQKPEAIQNKHILLIDDVITTGATLESCGAELLKAGTIRLSLATLCYASR